ncbi:hypothetical protein [Bdellovibrio sp. HCB337]|uniref:hypothetical protein n=1 Tax=Bdellovibrio sp. HCB337 TaxID=3394358 RepID=UPI0039A468C4
MKIKTVISSVLAILLSSQVVFAAIGTESGGGGDPDAVDFLLKVRVVGEWAKSGNAPVSDEETRRIFATARNLSLKMDKASETPIVMVKRNLVDASGAGKVALFDLKKFKIEVTRSKWKKLSEEDKYITAALELFGLAQVQNRYGLAGELKKVIKEVMGLSVAVGATKELPGAQVIYLTLASTFPEFDESIGGFSYEITLKELSCSSSNSLDGNGAPLLTTECIATDALGTQLVRPATNLYLTLLNSGVPVDTHSEPGTTYIVLTGVNCGVLEPRSTPDNPVTPEYFCSVGNPIAK